MKTKTKTAKKQSDKIVTLREIMDEVKGRNRAIMFDHFVDGRRSCGYDRYECSRWLSELKIREDSSGRAHLVMDRWSGGSLAFPLDTQVILSDGGTRVKWDEVCGGALVRSNELVFYSHGPMRLPVKLKTISEVVSYIQKDSKAIAIYHEINGGEEHREYSHANGECGVQITSGSYSMGQSTLLEGKPVVTIHECRDSRGRGVLQRNRQIPMEAEVRHAPITFVGKEGTCIEWDETVGGVVVRTHGLCFFSSSPMKVGT